jgi:hypothetical protein
MPTAPLQRCHGRTLLGRCRERQAGPRCALHERTSSRNHNGVKRQEREHGAAYDRLARTMKGQPCALRLPGCTGTSSGADLIVPRSRGGRAELGNVRPACSHCQSVQGGQLVRAG